jgi:hypothetical protein
LISKLGRAFVAVGAALVLFAMAGAETLSFNAYAIESFMFAAGATSIIVGALIAAN